MRVLFIEDSADGLLDLALRAQDHGHSSRYYVRTYDPHKSPTGRGLVERAPDWRDSMRWCDLCIVGGNGKWLAELDAWRARGVPMIGGCAEAAKLELDRLAGMAAFKKAGIPIPPFRQCSTLDEAIEYVAKRDEGCAVKACGDADRATSVVAKTAKEMVWRLAGWKREGKSFPHGLIVQDRIEGVEAAVGAWIGPDGFVPGWEENFEEKRMFAGNLGPTTGEMGTVMRLVRSSRLADKVLKPFEDMLVRTGFCGNVDVNTIIDEEGTPWPLEWTVRLGWPSTNIELALHAGDHIEFLAGVASGETPHPASRSLGAVAVGVVMALPPYPFGHERAEEVVNVPIWGVTPGIEDQLHYCNVAIGDAPGIDGGKIVKEPHLVTSGSYVLVATGIADNIVAARNKAHRVLDRLTIPASPFWRNDIGLRLRKGLDDLARHGYARGLNYST